MKAVLLLAITILSLSAITKIEFTDRTTQLYPVGTVWTFLTSFTEAADKANLCKLSSTHTETGHTMTTAKADNLLSEFHGFDDTDSIEFTGTNIESIIITMIKDLHEGVPISFFAVVTCPTDVIGNYTLEVKNGASTLIAKKAVTFVNPDATTNGASSVAALMMACLIALMI